MTDPDPTSDLPEPVNEHLVAAQGDNILMLLPPQGPITTDQALTLAAWLVAIADPTGDRFEQIKKAVLNT